MVNDSQPGNVNGSAPRLSPATRSRWRLWVGLACLFVFGFFQLFDHVLSPALEPCGWLDIFLQRSGCSRALPAHQVLQGFGFNKGLALSRDGTILVSTTTAVWSDDGNHEWASVQVWQVESGRYLTTWDWTTEWTDCSALSPDGTLLALGTSHGVTLRQVLPGEMQSGPVVIEAKATTLTFSPDGAILASVYGTEVQLWRVADRAPLKTIHAQDSGETVSVAFSPDGAMVVLGGSEGLSLWRVPDGVLVRRFVGAVYSNHLVFSPDGRILASGEFNDIWLWEVSDGTVLRKLEGHPNTIEGLAFSPSGEALASASGAELRLWRVSDGVPLRVVQTSASQVVFSPDGTTLLSEGEGGTIRLWHVPEAAIDND